MARVLIPSLARDLTGGKPLVTIEGTTVGQVMANLEVVYPGFRARLFLGDDLGPHVSLVVDGEVSELRLFHPLAADSEVQFVPAVEGG